MNEKDPSGRECNDSKCANETSGLVHGGVKIMAIPTRQGSCSPTSALERNEWNVEGGAEESFLPDGQRQIYTVVERHRSWLLGNRGMHRGRG